ncbi:MAG: glycosyltransferase [Sideroxydans sp.]|nr:glycosyltransferase [Sideroxydans sp.]
MLSDGLGWDVGAAPVPKGYDAIHLMGYFEAQIVKDWPDVPVGAYFTHREESQPEKARLFDEVAERVDLRIATCRLYAEPLSEHGLTVQCAAPLERDRFVITDARPSGRRPVAGFSGYTYKNHRKGEDLVETLLRSDAGKAVDWKASGRGWPVATKGYTWNQMPEFYQSLDVLVVPSRVEGIPMPPLEALACGVPVVVPREVGLLDELPDVPGIYRYDKGDAVGLLRAFEEAVDRLGEVDREALRAATEPYSVQNWVRDHKVAYTRLLEGDIDGGLAAEPEVPQPVTVEAGHPEPEERETGSTRGIYCVAFGDPARACAERMMTSAKRHMPDIPICLVGARPMGIEDVFVEQPDSDVGGRRAKLRAYELAPAEWGAVLYLDADTEIVGPVYRLFEWIEDGWDLCITHDVGETLHSFQRKNNIPELNELEQTVGTLHALQFNGGVWSFGRNERVARFFARFKAEYEVHLQRDQGALIRALHAEPLKVWVLGHEWNTFPKYTPGVDTAGILHWPGDARRWEGKLPGRIDSPEAWKIVEQHERKRQQKELA